MATKRKRQVLIVRLSRWQRVKAWLAALFNSKP